MRLFHFEILFPALILEPDFDHYAGLPLMCTGVILGDDLHDHVLRSVLLHRKSRRSDLKPLLKDIEEHCPRQDQKRAKSFCRVTASHFWTDFVLYYNARDLQTTIRDHQVRKTMAALFIPDGHL
jgi:hypothetical protein